MSKKGRQRRTPGQRIARRIQFQQAGPGVHRLLTPEQAASPEFAGDMVDEVSETEEQKQ